MSALLGLNSLRAALTVIAGFGSALVAYAIVFTHGNPRPEVGDPLLAYQLIPLELAFGALVAFLTYRAFTRRATSTPRQDVAERMLYRLAMRRGGVFTLDDLVRQSPLSEAQARDQVQRLLDAGRLSEQGGTYRLAQSRR